MTKQVFDDGYNPREPGTFGLSKTLGGGNGGGSSASSNVDDPTRPMRKELGCVLYASNVLGSRGPRKMQVLYSKAALSTSVREVLVKFGEIHSMRSATKLRLIVSIIVGLAYVLLFKYFSEIVRTVFHAAYIIFVIGHCQCREPAPSAGSSCGWVVGAT